MNYYIIFASQFGNGLLAIRHTDKEKQDFILQQQ